jgi:hypothetical protein
MMNFGEIKSFLKGAPLFDANQAKGPHNALANIKPNLEKLASAASIVQRSESNVLSFSVLNKVVTDKLQSLDPNAPVSDKKPESLFDFSEVAKNVLSFVEKAMMKAKGDGADNDMLQGMMDKARKGVEDGFAQAREELGSMGEIDDEVEEGINKSYDTIQNGLNGLENKLFGREQVGELSVSAAALDYSLEKSSSITIKTNDGDTVSINFAEAMRYQASAMNASYSGVNEDGSATEMQYAQTSESRYHAVGFSFSVEGELDEDEKEAISALVQDVSKLADEFFNGDLDKAFKQATELGFDESELSGFSLQMTRVEKISVAQAYQQVAQYEDGEKPNRGNTEHPEQSNRPDQNIGQMIKPVANYLKGLMEFLEEAREKLNDSNDLQSLVTESVTKYLEFKGEGDISTALERFAAFNQRILGTLDPAEVAKGETTPGIAVGEPTPGQPAPAVEKVEQ